MNSAAGIDITVIAAISHEKRAIAPGGRGIGSAATSGSRKMTPDQK